MQTHTSDVGDTYPIVGCWRTLVTKQTATCEPDTAGIVPGGTTGTDSEAETANRESGAGVPFSAAAEGRFASLFGDISLDSETADEVLAL